VSQREPATLDTLSPDDRERLVGAMRRGASRRELLGLLASLGIAGSFGGSLIAGAGAALAQTPKKGGRIRVAGFSSSTADTLDPAKQSLSTDYVRCTMFYSGLTELDDRLVPQLALAESIENDKATTWTIKLRKGVQFHDGKELDAQDVVYSLSRHADPAVGSKAKALASQMTEIKATGKHEVEIRLSSPNADLPVVLGTFHFLIVKAGTTDFATAVGTGPYKCKEFAPGVKSIGVRNANYWKENRPFVDEIEFFGIPDAGARVNALLSGDVDLIGAIDPRATKQVLDTKGFAIFETRSGNYTDLVMRADSAPGSNPDFVLGMKYLFDREQMKRAIFRGYAEVANDQPIPPLNRYHAADIPQRAYDPDKAKFHLAKAGVLDGTLPIVASPAASSSVEMAVVLQQAAQKAGLKLEIKQVPADGYWSNYWMKVPVGFGNINPRPTADILFSLFFKSDAPWNESAWKNEKFDQLLVAARAETDEGKRKQMYHDMQVLIHEGSGIGIPVFINNLDAHATKLKGLRPMGTGGMMGYAFAEHVWLEG
jgi:peptide/nickel transport system substrate-binding protein